MQEVCVQCTDLQYTLYCFTVYTVLFYSKHCTDLQYTLYIQLYIVHFTVLHHALSVYPYSDMLHI